ncbi:glycosyltransferase [Meiothermus sp.]|uniref:glycosyltransferase n=1 Tax=Meiothermus sp. TaxID=1955249 RepID=UPI0021DF1CF4|nr:nucleotide disphospho-sugar-binding domain-containing protein [Meiothermus sp.]GIW25413.1 MAG: glycosyl transferase [Meiothermus sp.]
MGLYMAYTSPARGHLYPILPTLLELQRRGHQVVVYTLASEVKRLHSLGIEAFPLDPAVEGRTLDDWQANSPLSALQAAMKTWIDRAHHDGPALLEAIREHRPAGLLIDINAWGAIATAETAGLPWATWCPYFLPVPSHDAPPFGLGLPPARGPLGRLRDRLLTPVLMGSYNRALPALNASRASLGAPLLKAVSEVFLRAPLLLYFTAEPFEYPRSDWHSSVRMIGPGIWDPPAPTPEWLKNVDKPLVLVTCSTEYQNDGKIIETALQGLANEEVFVVATTASIDPTSFKAPLNARIERFLPHGLLLERAACVVCHGGMGITQKALAAGVPLVIVPFGRDQIEVARHLQVAGAGVSLPKGKLRPDLLRQAVKGAMQMKAGAQRLAEAFRRAGGAVAAADAMEALHLQPPRPLASS